mgnify:FL=1
MATLQQSDIEKKLAEIYYDPKNSGSFGGINRLLIAAQEAGLKVDQKQVKKFLTKQASYSLHKPARKNFTRNPTIVKGIDDQWQVDLADMQSLSRFNYGYKYILTVIDVFSKFAWAVPVKTKSTNDVFSIQYFI